MREETTFKVIVKDETPPQPAPAGARPPLLGPAFTTPYAHLPSLAEATGQAHSQGGPGADASRIVYRKGVEAPQVQQRYAEPQAAPTTQRYAPWAGGQAGGAPAMGGEVGAAMQGLTSLVKDYAKGGLEAMGDFAASRYSNVSGAEGMAGAMEKFAEKVPILREFVEIFQTAVQQFTKVEVERGRAIAHSTTMLQDMGRNDLMASRIRQLEKTVTDRERYGGMLGQVNNWLEGTHSKLASAKAVRETETMMLGAADRYSAYSPEIAMAQGRAEMKRMMADMKSAKAHGVSLAGFISTKADTEAAMQAAMQPIMEKLYSQVATLGAQGKFDEMVKVMESMKDDTSALKYIKEDGTLSAELQKRMAAELKKIREGGEKDDARQDIFEKLLAGAKLLQGRGAAAHDPVHDAMKQSMLSPLG